MLRGAGPVRRAWSGLVAGVVLTAGVMLSPATAAVADTAPPEPSIPATVSADALPTVQVDGVVWSQAVVGNTVYAGGKFTTARPAGAAPGMNTVPRNNLLAYDIRTGALITSFAPTLNGQVLGVTASPDGSRIYVAGEFTTADGKDRYRIAAYSTATGALLDSFRPVLDFRARTVVVKGDVVYVGGAFNVVNGQSRPRLAAFRASDGALLTWAPSADAQVMAMVLSPDGSRIVVGGNFTTLNGEANYGMGALDVVSGATRPWAATQVVRSGGTNAAITSLSTDGSKIFGTAYSFGRGGNLEGGFAADPADGRIRWIEDCHGDTYSGYPVNGVFYTAGHAHYCGNLDSGFPQTEPWTYNRGIAFTTEATGVLKKNTVGTYFNFEGQPAPTLLRWWPQLDAGTFTGQNQGPWNVTGNGTYVVMGGEFPRVNGVPQQGLVRFAVRSQAPNQLGPELRGARFVPVLTPLDAGTVRVSWPANWDKDNEALTYTLTRDGGTEVHTSTVRSTFWDRPTISITEKNLIPGQTYRYRLSATDPLGNSVLGDTVAVVAPSLGAYVQRVKNDGPSLFWRLGETSGTAFDWVGTNDGTANSGVTGKVAGAIAGDSNPASAFSGTSSGFVTTKAATPGANRFTLEAWVKTTSIRGGKILGFGNSATGNSTSYDRHIYMGNTGRITFGVSPGAVRAVTSAGSYNDGRWHHVVASLGAAGMSLYVDGQMVGRLVHTTTAQSYDGFWRVGGDSLSSSWPNRPASNYLAGNIDEVAIYPVALPASTVSDHYQAGLGIAVAADPEPTANAAPTASFTSTRNDLTAAFDGRSSSDTDGSVASYAWAFGDGKTGTGATPSHTYAAAGTYTVTLTVTDDKGATGTTSGQVSVSAPAVEAGGTLAQDAFGRSVTGGWGSADIGGAWTTVGGLSNFSVANGTGRIRMGAAGAGPAAYLGAVSSDDTDATMTVRLDKAATGGGTYISPVGRRVGTSGDYRLKLRFQATGAVSASLIRNDAGKHTALASGTVPGISYTAGQVLHVRLRVSGTNPTTLASKVWAAGTTEPASWQLSTTDSTAALQAAGSVGVITYLSGSSTNAPVVASFDDLQASSGP